MDLDKQRIEEYKILHNKIDALKTRRDSLLSLTTSIYTGALIVVLGIQFNSGFSSDQLKLHILDEHEQRFWLIVNTYSD